VVDFDPSMGVFNLTSTGGKDAFVAKYTPSGTLVWAQKLGGATDDAGNGIAVGPDGSVYVAGSFSTTATFGTGSSKVQLTSAGSNDAFVAKFDALGKIVWARAQGGSGDDGANAIAIGSDGAIAATGYFQGTADFDRDDQGYNLTSVGPTDVFVSKLDADGEFLWAKRMGGIGWSQGISIGSSIAIATDGSVYTTGSFQGTANFGSADASQNLSCAGDTDVFVSKLSSSGNYVWARRMGGTGKDQGTGIALSGDAVYTTGLFWGVADFNPGSGVYNLDSAAYHRSFVSKLDTAGNFVWAHGIGGTGTDRAAGIAVATDGNIYATGGFEGTVYFDATATGLISAGQKDVFLAKLNTAGDLSWAIRMGGANEDSGIDVVAAPNGDLYTTGVMQGTADFDPGAGTFNLVSNGAQDLFVARFTTSYWDTLAPNAVAATNNPNVPNEPVVPPVTPTATAAQGIGLYNPVLSNFYLKNTASTGYADQTFNYGPGNSGWITLTGDWDGDGSDTIGMYNPTTSTFYLRNSNSGGFANVSFAYGPAGGGWTPLVGDWNGDGTDTIGLYNPTTSTFYLRNSNNTGFANTTFAYGPAGGGWTPIVGDWNGTSTDTIGFYNPTTSTFYLRNTNTSGFANTTFAYGPAGGGWTPIIGDWNADGSTTIGLYNPVASNFFLRNSNSTGIADVSFGYGPAGSGWTPLVGAWNGTPTLLAAQGAVTPQDDVTALTDADLQPIVGEAIARWAAAGLDANTLAKLAEVQFIISDLSAARLGQLEAGRVYLDGTAAGHGWFVDSTPQVDEEFSVPAGSKSDLRAIDPRAVDRIDLLTVVEHELGHAAGLDDLDAIADSIMNRTLDAGVRRTATRASIDGLFTH
jgi:hypothetical protein